MRARTGGRIAAAMIATVGAAAGAAYAAAPHATGGTTSELAGISGPHEVVGKQVYSPSSRKRVVVKCGPGESALGGGYILAGDFQPAGSPVPRSLPAITENTPSFSSVSVSGAPDAWSVVAIAPRNFSGRWGLTPKVICARGR